MSLPKAQLVDPQGNMNLPGMTATGIVTASSLKGVTTGSATGLTGNPDLDVGIVTASSFVGQGDGHAANLTGTPQLNLGVTTSTGFIGDAVGKAAGLTGTPNLNVGLITATSFVGFVTGDVTGNITGDVTGNITGNIQGDVEGNVTGNVSGLARGLGINGLNVWTGAGTSNLGVGVCTAIELYGDGSALTGAGSSAYIAQNVNATSGSTTIDLSYGNVIYYTASSNTTISFSNPSAAEQITFIRDTGNNYSITWPATVKWNNATAPTLFDQDGGYQIFRLTTGDTGSSYNAWEGSESPEGYGMFVYGYSNSGRLGLNSGSYNDFSSPTQVGTSFDFTGLWQVTYGGSQGVFQKNTNDLFVTGYNANGALGQNNTTKYSSPIQIPGTWTQVTAGGNMMMATKGGDEYVWGQNNYGQLGMNSVGSPTHAGLSSPTQLPGTWSSSAGKTCLGNYTSYAIRTNGTLWSWGRDFIGNLGHNQGGTYPSYPASKSSPTQIGTNTNWNQMLHCDVHATSATKTDGTLWSWGYNGDGQLGLNEATGNNRSSPTQVPGTNWSRVFMMNACQIATKTDGTLWAWGNNTYGQLAQNTDGNPTRLSSPTQIGTETTWTHGSLEGIWNAGGFCKKTDGTLWCWGINTAGQLGLNSRVNYSSPVQVTAYSDAWLKYGRMGGAANAIIK